MAYHDIIDNREEKLGEHINRILGSPFDVLQPRG